MSEGWERSDWRLDEARSRRLPRVEDLPPAGDGYDRAAVEAAFESFYRHAAELDRTLDVLESVAAFQREAGSLRADIRALRAASWGPVPTLRHTVATTAAGRLDRGGPSLDSWPRISLYAAFIIFVAVGSALADLSSGAIVALVLASWLVVGAAELAVSGIAGRVRRAPRGYPAAQPPVRDSGPVEGVRGSREVPLTTDEAAGEPGPAVEPEPAAEAVLEPAAEPVVDAEAEGAELEAVPDAPRAWRPWSRPDEPAAEQEPEAELEAAPEPVAEAEPEPEAEPELVADTDSQPEFVPTLEPFGEAPEAPRQPVEIMPEVEPFEAAEPEAEAEPEPEHVEAEAEPDPLAETEPEPEGDAPPAAVEPERSRRLRFWHRRQAEAPAALEPLPEPRHVRIVDVEEPPAEEVPVAVEVVEEPASEPVEEPAAEARPEVESEPEPELEHEPEPEPEPERLDDTDERPAVAVAPSPLRLRRGRR